MPSQVERFDEAHSGIDRLGRGKYHIQPAYSKEARVDHTLSTNRPGDPKVVKSIGLLTRILSESGSPREIYWNDIDLLDDGILAPRNTYSFLPSFQTAERRTAANPQLAVESTLVAIEQMLQAIAEEKAKSLPEEI